MGHARKIGLRNKIIFNALTRVEVVVISLKGVILAINVAELVENWGKVYSLIDFEYIYLTDV